MKRASGHFVSQEVSEGLVAYSGVCTCSTVRTFCFAGWLASAVAYGIVLYKLSVQGSYVSALAGPPLSTSRQWQAGQMILAKTFRVTIFFVIKLLWEHEMR